MPGETDSGYPDPRRIQTRAEFAEALTALRKRAGHTVRSLAEELDSPRATIGGYLNGRHLPWPQAREQLGRLLTALHVHDAEKRDEWMRALNRVWHQDLCRRSSVPLSGGGRVRGARGRRVTAALLRSTPASSRSRTAAVFQIPEKSRRTSVRR